MQKRKNGCSLSNETCTETVQGGGTWLQQGEVHKHQPHPAQPGLAWQALAVPALSSPSPWLAAHAPLCSLSQLQHQNKTVNTCLVDVRGKRRGFVGAAMRGQGKV